MATIKVHTEVTLSTADIANAILSMPQYEIASMFNIIGSKMDDEAKQKFKYSAKSGILNLYGKEFLELLK